MAAQTDGEEEQAEAPSARRAARGGERKSGGDCSSAQLGSARRRRALVPTASQQQQQQQQLLSQERAARAPRQLPALARSILPFSTSSPQNSEDASFFFFLSPSLPPAQLLRITLFLRPEAIGARAHPFQPPELGERGGKRANRHTHTHAPHLRASPSTLRVLALAAVRCSSVSQLSLAERFDFLVDWLAEGGDWPESSRFFLSVFVVFPPLPLFSSSCEGKKFWRVVSKEKAVRIGRVGNKLVGDLLQKD